MPVHKVTNFLSESSAFFKNNDAHKAMYSIMDVIKWLKMSETHLFGMKSKRNNVYSLLQVFHTLLLFPCFMVRNPYNYGSSSLSHLMDCKKDVFYRFMNNPSIDWRKLLYHLNLQLWSKIRVRSEHRSESTCLIVDFALLDEKGKKGNFGMSDKELKQRFTKDRDVENSLQERIREYSNKKTDLMIEMITRAIKKGIKFRYVLADSWFANKDIIRFIHSRHVKCDYLGMIKVGEKGKTTYHFERKELTAPALIKLLIKRDQKKYSRKLRCYYMTADVTFGNVPVRLFFVKRSKAGAWNGLITTNMGLDFFEAYRLYSQRWALEVIFKESKGLLGLGKCQANNFASQIAATSLTALQYNILSVVKRLRHTRQWENS